APLDVMVEVGDALHAAPLPALLISLGSVQPWSIVAELHHRYGRSMVIGAGPIRDDAQMMAAIDAGAQFVMSGGYDAEIGEVCRRQGVLYVPCIHDAAHVRCALDADWRMVAFFPARRLGSETLATLVRRFPSVRVIAAGGMNGENLGDYARAGAAAVLVRGVLGARTKWRMNEVIVQMRRLRAAWDAASR
ncbi:MAG: bifunctional 4-hydroxy-2-oxoglutarate aldolase/2-dehydro-3-deoxy-phosphogluconate aldolase, partial [Caldilinea sp.]